MDNNNIRLYFTLFTWPLGTFVQRTIGGEKWVKIPGIVVVYYIIIFLILYFQKLRSSFINQSS